MHAHSADGSTTANAVIYVIKYAAAGGLATDTVTLTLDLCAAGWDTTLTLVNPDSQQRVRCAWIAIFCCFGGGTGPN